MKKKKKRTECPAGEKWAVPYADFLSLLLALFIALYALAAVNKEKLEALKQAFIQIYSSPKIEQTNPILKMDAKPGQVSHISASNANLSGTKSILEGNAKKDKGLGEAQSQSSSSIFNGSPMLLTEMQRTQLAEDVIQLRKSLSAKQNADISIEDSQDGFVINLPASILFKPDSAQIINQDTLVFLNHISTLAKDMSDKAEIMVNGYTDNIAPGKNSMYKNNWELSSARAASVVQQLIDDGVDGGKLGAVGYGEYRPIATNATKDGREKNRRVSISFKAASRIKAPEQPHNILDR